MLENALADVAGEEQPVLSRCGDGAEKRKPRQMFREILALITRLRAPPAPA